MFKLFFLISILFLIFAPMTYADSTTNNYLINVSSIKLIECVDKDGDHFFGTATVIAKDKVLTANHVIYGATSCVIDGKPVTMVSHSEVFDYAVLGVDLPPNTAIVPYSCDGYIPSNPYFSFGYSKKDLVMTLLVADGSHVSLDKGPEYPFEAAPFYVLNGNVYSGMSGGPVFDIHGKIVGINNVSDAKSEVSGSRELSETLLCAAFNHKKPLYP